MWFRIIFECSAAILCLAIAVYFLSNAIIAHRQISLDRENFKLRDLRAAEIHEAVMEHEKERHEAQMKILWATLTKRNPWDV